MPLGWLISGIEHGDGLGELNSSIRRSKALRKPCVLLVSVAVVLSAVAPAQAQGIPRLPRLPKVEKPKVPVLPPARSASSVDPSIVEESQGAALIGGAEDDFMKDYMKLASSIDANADGAAIDQLVDEIKAAAQRLAMGNYAGITQQRHNQVREQRKQLAEVALRRVDSEMEWAIERVSRNDGSNPQMPILAYNQILALDTELFIATAFFPGNSQYEAAKAKVGSLLAKFASREQAAQAFDEMALAAAANVRMPPAITEDRGAKAMFRRAWATSGIPYHIQRINVTSGWRDKRQYGHVIGQVRDAAIAAKDPNSDRCNLYDFTMFRDRGGAVRRDSHSTKRIVCENIPK